MSTPALDSITGFGFAIAPTITGASLGDTGDELVEAEDDSAHGVQVDFLGRLN
jgi:hypothetical protein